MSAHPRSAHVLAARTLTVAFVTAVMVGLITICSVGVFRILCMMIGTWTMLAVVAIVAGAIAAWCVVRADQIDAAHRARLARR